MRKIFRSMAWLLLALLVFLPTVVLAQNGGHDLSWNTIDGGGYTWSEVCNHTFNKGFHRLYHCMEAVSKVRKKGWKTLRENRKI